jgi:predicted  nucleic acid-binding Zn-ribbon protein
MYSFIRQENTDMKNKFFADMQQQSLELTIYARKAVAAVTLAVSNLESQVNTNKSLSDQDIKNLKDSIASTKSDMANAIAAEQSARQQLSDNLQQLTDRVNLMQADLTQTQRLVAQNADQLMKLTVNFNQEKQNIEDRFQSERAKTDAQFSNIQKDMQDKLQNVADQAAKLVQDLGADVQTHFKSVVTDIAVLNSRQASLENSLKSFIEQYQTNRGKTLNLESKLAKPKQDATNAIISSMRAITDLQIKFIKILDPDEDHKEYYNNLC